MDSLLPSVPDQKDHYIATAASLYKHWADSPSPRPKKLDLRLHLSLITNAGIEHEDQALLCNNIDYLTLIRSTTIQSGGSSKETTSSTMTTAEAPQPDFRTLKWLVTARRGRKSLVSSTVESNHKEKEDQKQAKPSDESAQLKTKNIAKFSEQAIDAKPIAFFDGEKVVNMFSAGYEHRNDGAAAAEIESITPVISHQRNMLNNFSGNRFKCNECDKSFPTHQALGGHKTSHNKRNATRPQEKKQGGPFVTRDHRCKICSKTFPTGQALGGHQRLHYVVPVKAPTLATTALATSQNNALCKKTIGFDLNQLPELDADEEVSLDLSL